MSSPALRSIGSTDVGLHWITRAGERELDTGMSFGLLRLAAGVRFSSDGEGERAFVLLSGAVELSWGSTRTEARRDSLFDERPTTLHVDERDTVEIAALGEAELAVVATANERRFAARLFEPASLLDEERRGENRVDDAAFRFVRTVFDERNRPEANLVLGEVVSLPGRWSSWPPHHHPQPELYHYRFDRPEGYGHGELGADVYRVAHGDTLKIVGGLDHAQVAAPGYAMWYLWAIRHLPQARYTTPEFTAEHRWTMTPGAAAWRPARAKGGAA
jgi:5-deoxy-glucuronate isomerase